MLRYIKYENYKYRTERPKIGSDKNENVRYDRRIYKRII